MKFKIISGGQTGADLAGLWVAKVLGLETGGTAPHGYQTLIGPQPALRDLFSLSESKGGYRDRTIENVRNSDMTLVFSRNMASPGTLLTINSCKKQGKDCYKIPDFHDRELDTVETYWSELTDETEPSKQTLWNASYEWHAAYTSISAYSLFHETCTLNVAGNATKNSRDIFEFTFMGLWALLRKLYGLNPGIIEGINPDKFIKLDPWKLALQLKDQYYEAFDAA